MSDGAIAKAGALLTAQFGQPDALAFAPGRVNLLGEHTDYNGGVVLPTPLRLGVAVAVRRNDMPGRLRMVSDAYDGEIERAVGEPHAGNWSDYLVGAIAHHQDAFGDAGLDLAVSADLPVGSGLSSSAALLVASLRALAKITGAPSDPVQIARAAHHTETTYIGLQCGIMDQFASSVGTQGAALFLNTRNLDYRLVALPADTAFVVIHSGADHQLTNDGYNTRVRECAAARAALKVESLSDLSPSDAPHYEALADLPARRTRHVVSENDRVHQAVAALETGDAARFGALMRESHASQRDDYEVSVPRVDETVTAALQAGALGARLTGGGFGGSVVALVDRADTDAFVARISAACPHASVLAIV